MTFYHLQRIGIPYIVAPDIKAQDAVSLKIVKVAKQKVEVFSHNKYLGKIFKSGHQVWCAEPTGTCRSQSFSSFRQAIKELTEYHYEPDTQS